MTSLVSFVMRTLKLWIKKRNVSYTVTSASNTFTLMKQLGSFFTNNFY